MGGDWQGICGADEGEIGGWRWTPLYRWEGKRPGIYPSDPLLNASSDGLISDLGYMKFWTC